MVFWILAWILFLKFPFPLISTIKILTKHAGLIGLMRKLFLWYLLLVLSTKVCSNLWLSSTVVFPLILLLIVCKNACMVRQELEKSCKKKSEIESELPGNAFRWSCFWITIVTMPYVQSQVYVFWWRSIQVHISHRNKLSSKGGMPLCEGLSSSRQSLILASSQNQIYL